MTIKSIINTDTLGGVSNVPSTPDSAVDQSYMALIEQFYAAPEYQTRDEINESDTALQKFKDDLITKGSAQYLKDLNEEKIEALVEEFRQKLLKEKEKNPEQPMDINQMVSDFKKQLLKEMMEAQEAERKNQNIQSTTLTSQDIFDNIKMVRGNEQKLGMAELGFLEQILSTSNLQEKKKLLT